MHVSLFLILGFFSVSRLVITLLIFQQIIETGCGGMHLSLGYFIGLSRKIASPQKFHSSPDDIMRPHNKIKTRTIRLIEILHADYYWSKSKNDQQLLPIL